MYHLHPINTQPSNLSTQQCRMLPPPRTVLPQGPARGRSDSCHSASIRWARYYQTQVIQTARNSDSEMRQAWICIQLQPLYQLMDLNILLDFPKFLVSASSILPRLRMVWDTEASSTMPNTKLIFSWYQLSRRWWQCQQTLMILCLVPHQALEEKVP